MTITTINPANGKEIKTYEEMTSDEVNQIIQDVNNAQLKWKHTDFAERSALLKKAAEVLRQNKREYAELMALEISLKCPFFSPVAAS